MSNLKFKVDDQVVVTSCNYHCGEYGTIANITFQDSLPIYNFFLNGKNCQFHQSELEFNNFTEEEIITKCNAEHIISLAKYYIQAVTECQILSSEELCYIDALSLFEKGNYKDAGIRALKSLAYTIGKSHPDYLICKSKTE